MDMEIGLIGTQQTFQKKAIFFLQIRTTMINTTLVISWTKLLINLELKN